MAQAEQLADADVDNDSDRHDAPIVVIGNGPIGMRLVKDLLDRLPQQRCVIYGEEAYEPYNRVQLSAWLAGDVDWTSLNQPLDHAASALVEQRIGYRITAIDREQRWVSDSSGRVQAYRKLVLATGSRPFVPGIPGIDREGVYTFRDMADAQRLMARRARSHRTVVLGGGLLGIETARGMQPGNTQVTIVEHADRLLGRQLDEEAAARLQREVEALGIAVVIGDGVAEVVGDARVSGVRLRSGRVLECDTLIIATGIRPNIGLAREAHLAFGKGIQVDDRMRTSDPDIYAVGECAEHRRQVYGLVAPGLEQAGVAAADIAGIDSHYAGSVAASRLKVVGTQVFSMGPVGAGDEDPGYGRAHVFRDDDGGYRKILVHRNRLVGAIGIGQWDETVRLQTQIGAARVIWPWQLLRFRFTGRVWPESDGGEVANWPATATVCQCTSVTRGTISRVIADGAADCAAVTRRCGAGSVCGSCKPLVQNLLGADTPAQPVAMHKTLLAGAVIALVGALMFFFAPAVPYPDSVQVAWRWDQLWRDGLFKQITGFSVLGLFAVGLLLSLRKRVRRLDRLGAFDGWRLAHVVLGVLVIVGLGLHTGFRTGSGLNFVLLLSFGLMLLVGALSTGVIALEHRIGGALATRLRRQSLWLHILLFWPVPALLGWHVVKTYWY
jgi:nitrite reductase (NADH) large subunit